MYEKPKLERFGTLRELTLFGFGHHFPGYFGWGHHPDDWWHDWDSHRS